ncbi:MAG: hypothetical protein A3F18_06545 [Legionellales bacterium RIFCSPHIGHO2_12_FULL_37_14]|nr:MAG: hypothetical protein A3F18_06545 [Legionellales bacterium RIFCSPHIGHO2_12_FULL_37_14]
MKYFSWYGFTKDGVKLKGVVYARNLTSAQQKLTGQQVIVQKIYNSYFAIVIHMCFPITERTITLFTRNMLGLITTGISIPKALNLLLKTQKDPKMQDLIQSLHLYIASGLSLNEALSNYPKQFNLIYCAFTAVGEEIGSLDKMLHYLLYQREKEELLKRKVKQAMLYPAIISFVSTIVMLFLGVFVVPMFANLFNNMHAPLPLLTLLIINWSKFLQENILLILGCLLCVTATAAHFYTQGKIIRTLIDKSIFKLPFIGKIINYALLAKMLRIMQITYKANMPLFQGIKLATAISNNKIYLRAINSILDELTKGQSLTHAFNQSKFFPENILEMLAVGDESGTMHEVLAKLADHYFNEIDLAVTTMSTLIEPVMITILSLGIGILIVAMYLPIFNLGSVI